MASSIPDELFWRSSIPEIDEVLERKAEHEKLAWERAGMITAAIYNVNRKKGARPLKASDFYTERKTALLEPEDALEAMDSWAKAHNAALKTQ